MKSILLALLIICTFGCGKSKDSSTKTDTEVKLDSYPDKHGSNSPCIYAFTVPHDNALNTCSVSGHVEKQIEEVQHKLQKQDHSIREFELFAREIKLQIREYGLDKNIEIREIMHQSVLLLNQTHYEREAARQEALQNSITQGVKFHQRLQNLTKIIESMEVWLLELKEENRIQALTTKSLEFMLQQQATEMTDLKNDMSALKEDISSVQKSSDLIQKVEQLTAAATSLTKPAGPQTRTAMTSMSAMPAAMTLVANAPMPATTRTSSSTTLISSSSMPATRTFLQNSALGPSSSITTTATGRWV